MVRLSGVESKEGISMPTGPAALEERIVEVKKERLALYSGCIMPIRCSQ